MRIGLPLDGWDLAVVDADGHPVPPGATGELIIGGVGLARYLDPAKDAEKYAPMPEPRLGARLPQRRPRGQRADRPALRRPRRRPGQARRAPHRARRGRQRPAGACPAVTSAAAAVRRTRAGNSLLVGYVTVDEGFDQAAALGAAARAPAGRPGAAAGRRRRACPPAPRARSTATPCRGRCRARPPSRRRRPRRGRVVGGRAVAGRPRGRRSRAATPTSSTSAAAASPPPSWSRACASATPRSSSATSTSTPTLGGARRPPRQPWRRRRRPSATAVRPTPLKTQAGQVVATVLVRCLAAPALAVLGGPGLRGARRARRPRLAAPTCRVAAAAARAPLFVTAPGPDAGRRRPGCGPAAARVRPGRPPARRARPTCGCGWPTRVADELGADRPRRRPADHLVRPPARRPGRAATSTCTPCRPSPGLLTPRPRAASVEPEVDLTGYWVDGDVLHLGAVTVGRARPHRGPQHAAARGRRRRRRRGRARVGGLRRRSRRGSSGRARPPCAAPTTRAARGASGRPEPRWWVGGVRRRRAAAARLLPVLAGVVAALLPLLLADRPGGARRPAAGCSSGCRSPRSSAWWCWPCSCWRRRPRRRPRDRPPACTRCAAGRRWRSGPRCGCSTRPAPGCSRSTPRP